MSSWLRVCAAYGVDFIDKYDTRSFLLGLAEEIADTGGAYTDKHFDKVGTRHGEERNIGFSCHSLGKKGFACSGRANEECSLGNFAAEVGIAFGIFQEFHDFFDLGLCF